MCSKIRLMNEEVEPVTYALPQYPLELSKKYEVKVVNEGLIWTKKIKEARGFIASDKFETVEITEIKVHFIMQLLCSS